jgi:hydrogenase maturation factor
MDGRDSGLELVRTRLAPPKRLGYKLHSFGDICSVPEGSILLSARAEVDQDGVPTWVEAAALADLHVGDYVVVYAGQALERMDSTEAEEMLAWYASIESMLEEADAAYQLQP